MKINWGGFATTKGRPVFASALGLNEIRGINYEGGFLIGWDKWSNGYISFSPGLFRR